MSISHLKSRSKGFTLVELLVVIAIIGTLATLLLIQLGVARAKARDAKRISDINQLRSAVELFYDDNNGIYPDADLYTLDTTFAAKYFANKKLPYDPVDAGSLAYKYHYASDTVKTRFHLWTNLENKAAAAFAADSDLNSEGWTGGATDGIDASQSTSEDCATGVGPQPAGAEDCIYDVGQE